jgi:hypothetical protein
MLARAEEKETAQTQAQQARPARGRRRKREKKKNIFFFFSFVSSSFFLLTRLDIERDRLARQGLDEDLHHTTNTESTPATHPNLTLKPAC